MVGIGVVGGPTSECKLLNHLSEYRGKSCINTLVNSFKPSNGQVNPNDS